MKTNELAVIIIVFIILFCIYSFYSYLSNTKYGYYIIGVIIIIILLVAIQYIETKPIITIKPELKEVGGLSKEYDEIVRRVFSTREMDKEFMEKIGIRHVKGIILHGPSGTGKTILASKIANYLETDSIEIINGPSLLGQYVGESEKNLRNVFKDAQEDSLIGGNKLFVYIFDEFDSLGRKRTTSNSLGNGSAARIDNNMVNQLLAILDGPTSLNNIIMIAVTNKINDIDPALLRPGRLEVHIEVALPKQEEREEIFKIHTNKLRINNFLSGDIDIKELSEMTEGMSGADIEGIVNNATSYLINNKDEDKKINQQNFKDSINSIVSFKPEEKYKENNEPNWDDLFKTISYSRDKNKE